MTAIGPDPEGDPSHRMTSELESISADISDLSILASPSGKVSPRAASSDTQSGKLARGELTIPSQGQSSSADEADDSTCAICLKHIPLAETAQPVGCDHVYCTCCILHWATFKEKPCCPQCKQPFSSLLTFRALDGQLHDSPSSEPIALLKCSEWFRDYVKMKDQKVAAANVAARRQAVQGSIIDESDYVDYSRYYQEFDDDEEVEDYYFSSAAGRARIVIGNRRHGPNGYMSSGRMQARPAPPQQASASTPKGGKAKAKGKAQDQEGNAVSQTPAKAQPSQPSRSRGAGKKSKPSIRLDTDDESDDAGPSRASHSTGRRARRNQKKMAADARLLI